MKKIFIYIILISIILLSSCTKNPSHRLLLYECENNNDCIIVNQWCSCPTGINKAFKIYWEENKQTGPEPGQDSECIPIDACPPSNSVICYNKQCKLQE